MRSPDPAFSTRVERCFRGGAATYQSNASLQAAVAARLARLARRRGDEDEAARAWQSLLALDAEGDAQTLWLMEALDSGDPC